MKGKNQESNKGFTLVEVIVAVLILGLALAPVLASFVSVARVNVTSRKKLAAESVAESLMESAKSFSLEEFAYQCTQRDPNNTGANRSEFLIISRDLINGTSFGGNAYYLGFSRVAGASRTRAFDFTAVTVDYSTDIVPVKSEGTTLKLQDNVWAQQQKQGGAISDDAYEAIKKNQAFLITGIPMAGSTYDAVIVFEYDKTKSEATISGEDGTDKPVQDVLTGLHLRPLKYYDVTIMVYKQEKNASSVDDLLSTYEGTSPLIILTGSTLSYQ